jgi:hypothetical protein
MDRYLPIGSVVLLSGGRKRIMIYGQMQRETGTGEIWDYVACPYPEGHLGKQFTYLFNHGQIARVFFIGSQDREEIAFSERLAAIAEGDDSAAGSPA